MKIQNFKLLIRIQTVIFILALTPIHVRAEDTPTDGDYSNCLDCALREEVDGILNNRYGSNKMCLAQGEAAIVCCKDPTGKETPSDTSDDSPGNMDKSFC